ncbi:MAG: type II toxin-antitoxin system PemK/MazF family toxin [Mariprofundaceae bacterium]
MVVSAVSGDYGKPRPAVVIQSDLFNPTHANIVVCPVTSRLAEAPLFRMDVPSNSETGLKNGSLFKHNHQPIGFRETFSMERF